MKEIKRIIETYELKKQTGIRMALATLIGIKGSSYRRLGARMLIAEDGEWVGGFSGGCLEADALKKAKFAISSDKAKVVTYDTMQDDQRQIGLGLGCNGIIDVLITPLNQKQNHPVDVLSDLKDTRESGVLFTVVSNSTKSFPYSPGSILPLGQLENLPTENGNQAVIPFLIQQGKRILNQGESQRIQFEDRAGERLEFFAEVLHPVVHLVLFGHNYDIQPMVELAKTLGWRVSIVANPFKLNKAVCHLADGISDEDQAFPFQIDPYTAIVLMAHDYQRDLKNLKRCIASQAPYIGLLGPRTRGQKIIEEIQREYPDLDRHFLERIHSPVGLDIGAGSPEAIALSILAEIQCKFAGRAGGFLRDREQAIHSFLL